MSFISSVVAILGGMIAASSLIESKSPGSKGFISSISQYKSVIGVLLLLWGLIGFFRILSNGLFSSGIIGLCVVTAEFVVGFLLAYELVQEYILKNNAKASEVGADMKRGLSQYQVPAGVALIILGVISFF